MLILGIETSCDETSVAVVENGKNILSNIISSQIDIHKKYGGVVPEIASRNHIKNIMSIVMESLDEAGKTLDDIDYIAVTYAPGLIGALLVGISVAKGMAYGQNIPLIPIHHLKGHIYSNFAEHNVKLPAITLVVSGGHTNIIYIDENHNFNNIGETLDDAVGESYDKIARVLGLGYPGGPIVDKLYYNGDPDSIRIPTPKVKGYDFSFSGIKTSVINNVNRYKMKSEGIPTENLCASFQKKVVEILKKKTFKAVEEYEVNTVLIAGGVAANSLLREEFSKEGKRIGIDVYYPSMNLCTDNGAMIAIAAYHGIMNNKVRMPDLTLNGIASIDIDKDIYWE